MRHLRDVNKSGRDSMKINFGWNSFLDGTIMMPELTSSSRDLIFQIDDNCQRNGDG